MKLLLSEYCFQTCFTIIFILIFLFEASSFSQAASPGNRIGDRELSEWYSDTEEVTTGDPNAENINNNEESWRNVIGTSRTEVQTLERVFIGLALILTLIAVIAWASRKRGLIGGTGYVTLVEDTTVAPGIRVLVLEILGRVLVTAYTDKGITLLTEITDEELVEIVRLEAGRRNPAGTFTDALGRWVAGDDEADNNNNDTGFIQRSIEKIKKSRK